MADIVHAYIFDVELNNGVFRYGGSIPIGLADEFADTFKVRITKGGAACTGVRSTTGYFIRPDGTTVMISGSVLVSTNVTMTLPPECYEYTGNYKLTIKVINDDASDTVETTVAIFEGRILQTRTNATADPGSIWSFEDIWAAINDKVDEPASEGTSGQALLTNGSGGRYWGNATSSGAAGSVIVNGNTYSLRTGSSGAAGYLTFVEES